MKEIILAFLVLFDSYGLYSQSKPIFLQGQSDKISVDIKIPKNAESLTDAQDQLQKLIYKLQSNNFITAALDTIVETKSQFIAQLFIGKKYENIDISLDSIQTWILEKAGVSNQQINEAIKNGEQFEARMKELLSALENSGYPLASMHIDNFKIDEQIIKGYLKIEKGNLIKYDSLHVIGNLNLSNSYLINYLGLKSDLNYNQEKLLEFRNKLQELSFVKLDANPSITFRGDRATINLPLSNMSASRFDFLIGLLPSDVSGNRRVTLAVDLTADLLNELGLGEHFYLQFRRLRPETQELSLDVNYPYLLDLPLGIELGLDIFKNSNEYLEVDFDLGWQYFFEGSNHVKAFWNLYSSRILDIDTIAILQNLKLPDQLDVKYNAFGLQLEYEQLDYKFNPRKGFSIDTKLSIGIKEVLPSLSITKLKNDLVDFGTSYDSLSDNSIQYRLEFVSDYFLPLGDRSSFKSSLHSGLLLSRNQKYRNEFFRIGGNKLLRGFDEESIFNSMYYVLTLEYRLLLGRNSFLATFGDYAFVKNEFKEKQWDQPFGIGAGLNFETSAGIFGISIASGSQGDIPFSFRNAKIHFGFQSIF